MALSTTLKQVIVKAKVFVPKKQKRKLPSDEGSMTSKKLKTSSKKDEENYIGYQPKDHHTEAG